MGTSYDIFTEHFIAKAKEYDFIMIDEYARTSIVDGYMKRAFSQFRKICKYDIMSGNDLIRELNVEIPEDDLIEIADIVSEGMLVQWMKPYVYRQENYENLLNTTDYSGYSPAELLHRITTTYKSCQKDFKNMIKEYSFNHGNLNELHL